MTDITTLKVQRETRPKIEVVIPFVVDDQKQETALNFVSWLRESKMAPGWSGVHNAWDAKCKGKTICKLSLINKGWAKLERGKYSWVIKLYCPHVFKNKYAEDVILNEGLQSVIWNRLRECTHDCLNGTKPCIGGNTYTLYDKEFKGICPHSLYPEIFDPDETTLNGVKRLLELEKQARTEK